MSTGALFLVFLQAVLLSQSGWASVAVMREALVEQRALLSDSQLTAFLALSQVTPGPLGFYLLYIGYSVHGWIGALAAWLALVVPSFLVVPIIRLVERQQRGAWLQGATTGVVVGSAALMLHTARTLGDVAITSPALGGLALVGIAALTLFRVPSVVVVVLSSLAGWAVL